MKIMHLLLTLDYGGAEKVAVNLIKKMQGRGFSFLVCALDRLGNLENELSCDTKIDCINRKGLDFLAPFRLAKVMKRFNPDVIHMHNSTALLYGVIAGKLAGINKMVVTQHGSILKESRRAMSAIRKILPSIDKIACVSEDIENFLKKNYRLNGNNVELIINGVDEGLYKKDEAKRNESRKMFCLKDKFVIGHVARLAPEKDQNTLLEAFSKMAKDINNARLVIIGDGPLKESLRLKAYSLELKDKVLFLGERSSICELMNMFDIFMLSSVREGTSLTLLEAMATELPIVATNAGGNPKVVIDGESGFITPARNSGELAEKAVYLYENPELRSRMGSAGRKRVIEEFSLSGMAEKYERIYRDI